MRNSKDFTAYIICGLFGFIGVVFLLVGAFWLKNSIDTYPNLMSTTATITYLEPYTYEDSDGDTQHSYHVFVDYTTANGIKEENIQIGDYSTSYEVGKEIKIYYDPDYPQKAFTISDLFIGPLAFTVMGAIFLILAIFAIVKENKAKARAKQ